MKPKFTPAYDKDMPSPKQRALPDVVQKAILKKKMRALRDKEKVAYRPGVPYMGSKGFGPNTASGLVTARQAHGATRMPGYAKGGPVKKDGYLTDKKGKPYARVHKGERVVPKEKKAFASYMDKVAGHAVMGQGYLKSMNDDHHMLCKSLESMIAQAEHLKMKLNNGLILPSWAEYKIYKAYDAINSANGASYPGHYLKVDHE